MHPILFEIPGLGFPVRSFGLMVVLGFLLGSYIFGRLGQRHSTLATSGLTGPELRDQQQAEAAGFASIPMWILAMYVIVEVLRGSETGQRYLDDPLTVFFYWEGGLVMYGGAFGGIAFGLLAARKFKISLLQAMDLGLAAGFIGLSVGRIGCLLVGDDFGKIVPESARDLPFPITVHHRELPRRQHPRHVVR
jgi:phosphatidylglycerol:prolipoprotein diacylglycerol transferase